MTPTPLPLTGEIYLDARSPSRALRVTWHHESGLVVLSLWRENVCTGTFRLAIDEVPDLIDVLRAGLDASWRRSLRSPPASPDDVAVARRRADRLSDAG